MGLINHKNRIPTFIIEEHNEAFFIWHYCISNRILNRNNNLLIHVDEHSDMGTPRFNKSIDSLNGNLVEIKDFTSEELNIASFIMPAIYQGIFNEVYWVKQNHRSSSLKSNPMYIKSLNDSGKKLMSGKKDDILDMIEEYRLSSKTFKEFNYHLVTEADLSKIDSPVIDIDLDYFSCSGLPNQNKEIVVEITESEFLEFKENEYHRLRFLPSKVRAKNINSSYFYIFNYYNEIYPSTLQKSESEIEERISRLISTFRSNYRSPQIITICRSRYSEYTPPEQWEFIEQKLLDGLSSLFELDIHLINDIKYAV